VANIIIHNYELLELLKESLELQLGALKNEAISINHFQMVLDKNPIFSDQYIRKLVNDLNYYRHAVEKHLKKEKSIFDNFYKSERNAKRHTKLAEKIILKIDSYENIDEMINDAKVHIQTFDKPSEVRG